MLLQCSGRIMLFFTVRFWKQWGVDDIPFKQYGKFPPEKRDSKTTLPIFKTMSPDFYYLLRFATCLFRLVTFHSWESRPTERKVSFGKCPLEPSKRSNVQEAKQGLSISNREVWTYSHASPAVRTQEVHSTVSIAVECTLEPHSRFRFLPSFVSICLYLPWAISPFHALGLWLHLNPFQLMDTSTSALFFSEAHTILLAWPRI